MDDDNVDLSNISDEIGSFCIDQLNEKHSRADYAEFLKLVLIFLGKTPPSGVSFRSPGAFHHARWMAKVIYCLKIYLFRGQFELKARELKGIRDICLFVVTLYVKAWFYAPFAAAAPNVDLAFLIDLHNYGIVDKDISNAALKKMCGHLWYLSDEAVGLAFFDNSINVDVKAKMVQSLRGDPSEHDNIFQNRNIIQPKDVPSFKNKTLAFFVTKRTAEFFKRFNISTEFMAYEPSTWPQHNSYIEGLQVVQKMQVVNDVSERKVKLMEEFNQLLTRDEEQKQFLLLTVDKYRQQYSSHLKSTLLQNE